MHSIEVDFDVFKALMMRRPSEDVSENDVLRQLLGLPATRMTPKEAVASPPGLDWVTKGVRFPPGTEFRAHYKGKTWLARVENGALVLDGKRFQSPSAAAMSITGGKPVNGWLFWDHRPPGHAGWQRLRTRRKT